MRITVDIEISEADLLSITEVACAGAVALTEIFEDAIIIHAAILRAEKESDTLRFTIPPITEGVTDGHTIGLNGHTSL